MKTIIVSTLLALGITACMMPEQMKTKIDKTNLDTTMKPGDDFYGYANGEGINKNR